MFSDTEVIEASRNFVCVRIESYESKETQNIVRSHLQGRFANTAFCILAPDGKERLTRSGRSPRQVSLDLDRILEIAQDYQPKGHISESKIPDFNSFKLALNVASADQRVLILIAGNNAEVANTEKRLRSLAWSKNAIGRFQYDLETDAKMWKEALSKRGRHNNGIFLIHPAPYGLKGEVIERLSLDSSSKKIAAAMARANKHFAATTEKKNHSEHVSTGRRTGKKIEMAIEFGEDRDGDGKIDHRRRRRN